MRIEVTGLEKLIGKLHALGGNVDEVVDEALQQGAKKIQNDAKRLIKAKNAFDTGRLHGSITVEKIPDGYSVGTNVEYAPYIEYGTGIRGDPTVNHTTRAAWHYKSGKEVEREVKGMRARPYLRPAFNVNKEYTVKLIRSKLRKAITQRLV